MKRDRLLPDVSSSEDYDEQQSKLDDRRISQAHCGRKHVFETQPCPARDDLPLFKLRSDQAHAAIDHELGKDHQWQREEQPSMHLTVIKEGYPHSTGEPAGKNRERNERQPRDSRHYYDSPGQVA